MVISSSLIAAAIIIELLILTIAGLVYIFSLRVNIRDKTTALDALAQEKLFSKQVEQKHQLLASELAVAQQKISEGKTQAAIEATRLLEQTKLTQTQQALKETALRKETELQTQLNAIKQLPEQFAQLSSQTLQAQSKDFQDTGKKVIEQTTSPIKKEMDELRRQFAELGKESTKERQALKTTVEQLASNMNQWDEESKKLTQALTGSQVKTRGDWGELTFEKLLQRNGLQKETDYLVQPSYHHHGKILRPDFVISMPEKRSIVIDCKVTMTSWLDYSQSLEQADESLQATKLQAFVHSVNDRIKELADKQYELIPELGAVDMVLMYIPIEPAYISYLHHHAQHISLASQRKITLVSPTTTLPILQAIAYIWRLQKQHENSSKVISKVESLSKKVDGFLEDFDKVGKQLQTAQNTFGNASKKLREGRGNVVKLTEDILELQGKSQEGYKHLAPSSTDATELATETN